MVQFTAFTLAHYAALESLKRFQCNPIQLASSVTPYRRYPFTVHGLRAPDFYGADNVIIQDYINLWRFSVGENVNMIARALYILYTKGEFRVHLCYSWDIFERKCREHLPPEIQLYLQTFPYVTVTNNHHGLQVHCTMITLSDYIAITDRLPAQFAIDIAQIILFGFIVDRQTVDGLRINDTALSMIISCLRQGYVDWRLVLYGGIPKTSAFDPMSGANANAAYANIGRLINNHIVNNRNRGGKGFPEVPEKTQQAINAEQGIGSNLDAIRLLSKMGALKYKAAYGKYLQRNLPAGLIHYTPTTAEELHMDLGRHLFDPEFPAV